MQNIFTLPEDVTIYCGHGPSTTVGHEKKHNPYLQ
jgi:glyoxylase-like metal-dependent hydrolase (beta-lactamase superfamily II)